MFASKANHDVGDGLGGYVERIARAGFYGERAGDACLGNVGYMGVLLGRTMDGVGEFFVVGYSGIEGAVCCEGLLSDGDCVALVEVGEAFCEGYCDGSVFWFAKVDANGFGAANA